MLLVVGKVGCNYGGFTTLYDRAFGTVYHGYDEMVNRLAERIRDAKNKPC